jgi:hypothetical protein
MLIKLSEFTILFVFFLSGFELMDGENKAHSPGLVFSQGTYWKEMRRFLLKNLRDFGFGKSEMDVVFQEEVGKLCQILAKRAG